MAPCFMNYEIGNKLIMALVISIDSTIENYCPVQITPILKGYCRLLKYFKIKFFGFISRSGIRNWSVIDFSIFSFGNFTFMYKIV